jgi:DNA polymerase-3 subunit gamma/tau
MRYIRIFSELSNDIKYASQKRIQIEIAIIKLCRPQMEKDYGSLVDRLDSLERKVKQGVVVAQGSAGAGPVAADRETPKDKPALPKAIPEDIRQVIASWSSIISELTGVTRSYLKKALRSLGEDGSLMLVFDDPIAYEYLENDCSECQSELKEAVAERIGKEINILVRLNDTGRPGDELYPDLGALIQFDIDEEDD